MRGERGHQVGPIIGRIESTLDQYDGRTLAEFRIPELDAVRHDVAAARRPRQCWGSGEGWLRLIGHRTTGQREEQQDRRASACHVSGSSVAGQGTRALTQVYARA